MAIIAIMEMPRVTQAQYEEVAAKLTNGRGLPQSPADLPVPGLISHTAGPTEDGWFVVDVWESQDAFDKFNEVIMPLVADWGVPGNPPKVHQVFHMVT